jgi:hypothetical protein
MQSRDFLIILIQKLCRICIALEMMTRITNLLILFSGSLNYYLTESVQLSNGKWHSLSTKMTFKYQHHKKFLQPKIEFHAKFKRKVFSIIFIKNVKPILGRLRTLIFLLLKFICFFVIIRTPVL